MIGTALRLALDTCIPHTGSTFPLSTLVINVVGSFALGALVSTVWRRPALPGWLRVGLGTGLIGSFTTFSALVVSLVAETSTGLWMLALFYLLVSLFLGFTAAALGLTLGRGRPHRGTTGPLSRTPGPADLDDE